MNLIHGTTRARAEQILKAGPLPHFREPGDTSPYDFCTYVDGGPAIFKSSEIYARRKSQQFPGEGPPVILVMDVPMEIILRAVEPDLPLENGYVQFNPGCGLEELIAAWPTLTKVLRSVSDA